MTGTVVGPEGNKMSKEDDSYTRKPSLGPVLLNYAKELITTFKYKECYI